MGVCCDVPSLYTKSGHYKWGTNRDREEGKGGGGQVSMGTPEQALVTRRSSAHTAIDVSTHSVPSRFHVPSRFLASIPSITISVSV